MKIGNLEINNNLILAPIAGYSDAGMRALCKKYGAGLTFTEMVSAKGLYYNNSNTKDLLFTYSNDEPVGVQLFGSEPEIIAHAIRMAEIKKFPIIDINMGCPVPKIIKNGEGSALMTDPDLVYDIIKAAVKAAENRPITAKIRAGFTSRDKNAVEIAQAIESAGGAAVTVHGRTRDMYYSGKADLDIIKEVKKRVSIPVIGNGDVFDNQSYNHMLDYTGVDFVMVARGAIGKPYIFAQLLQKEYDYSVVQAITEHLELLNFLPEHVAVNNMKKQIAFYVKGIRNSKQIKENVFKATNKEELLVALRENL